MQHARRIIALLFTLGLIFCLASCNNQSNSKSEQTQASAAASSKQSFQPYTFVDDLGHEIKIDKELTAIVPSGSLAQVMLLGMAPDLMVGLGGKMPKHMAEYIPDYNRLSQLTYFGTILGGDDLDVEALASTNAQLIIDMGYTKKGYEEKLASTQELTGINCVFINAKLDNYGESLRKLGKLLGREEKAEEMAAWCDKVYNRALNIMEKVGDKKVNGLYVLGDNGLNVIAQSQSQAEVLNLVFNNIAVIENASGKGNGNAVNMEQISLWNPDFVIFGPDSIYQSVATDDTWKQISAIANNHYVESPGSPYNWTVSPPACQRYLALLWLPSILYPEYCDYDLQQEVTEYYKLFYGVDLSNEQYAALTANAFFK